MSISKLFNPSVGSRRIHQTVPYTKFFSFLFIRKGDLSRSLHCGQVTKLNERKLNFKLMKEDFSEDTVKKKSMTPKDPLQIKIAFPYFLYLFSSVRACFNVRSMLYFGWQLASNQLWPRNFPRVKLNSLTTLCSKRWIAMHYFG